MSGRRLAYLSIGVGVAHPTLVPFVAKPNILSLRACSFAFRALLAGHRSRYAPLWPGYKLIRSQRPKPGAIIRAVIPGGISRRADFLPTLFVGRTGRAKRLSGPRPPLFTKAGRRARAYGHWRDPSNYWGPPVPDNAVGLTSAQALRSGLPLGVCGRPDRRALRCIFEARGTRLAGSPTRRR